MEKAGTMNNRFENDEALALSLAGSIATHLIEAIKEKGSASLIVSGGSTPKKLFKVLSEMNIPWDKIKIGLCDERLVEPTHNDSNERLVRENLMVSYAQQATFISMASEDETLCSTHVKELLMPFDVLVLGMGEDAHTASLFPNNPRLAEAYDQTKEDICIKIVPQSAPHTRMSLTLGAILSAKHLYLHFQGESKIGVYEEALQGNDLFAMPIRAILHQTDKKIEVYSA